MAGQKNPRKPCAMCGEGKRMEKQSYCSPCLAVKRAELKKKRGIKPKQVRLHRKTIEPERNDLMQYYLCRRWAA